ncbi:MAG: glycosyltransferase, partial [Acidobacteriota bacterium]
GGIPEAVDSEKEALLVDAEDVTGLAKELTRAVSDAGLRRRLGEAARERFLRDFTARRMAAEYESLYRQLLTPSSAAPT